MVGPAAARSSPTVSRSIPPDRGAAIAALRGAAGRVFAPRAEIQLAYLYGSVARGQAGPHSDVDVAVVLANPLEPAAGLRLELDLELALGDATGMHNVDVRVANAAPLLLQGAVVTEGVLVFERERTARIAYETTTRSLYFDFLPAAQRMANIFAAALRESLSRAPTRPSREWPA